MALCQVQLLADAMCMRFRSYSPTSPNDRLAAVQELTAAKVLRNRRRARGWIHNDELRAHRRLKGRRRTHETTAFTIEHILLHNSVPFRSSESLSQNDRIQISDMRKRMFFTTRR
uniref:Transposase n=1 Tax=Steinernema glaseri TaxID=37863 RepID=A0A1I8AW51_9BILA